jgi:hypothetical protein
MDVKSKISIVGVAAVVLSANAASAEIRYTQNAAHQTTSLSGLDTMPDCTMVSFSGTVAQRTFRDDGVTMSEFVIEKTDGTRQLINVWVDDVNMALKSIVYDGLQRLIRVGRQVTGQAAACGAAGRVLTLDSIR